MYLFNEKGKAIEIYEMTPQEELIAAYRKKELEENIPLSERFYYASSIYSKHLLEDKDTFQMNELNYQGTMPQKFFQISHTFQPQPFLTSDSGQIICGYINGAYDSNKAIRVIDNDDKYFVLPKNDYYYHMHVGEYWMTNIIQIPESLYLLHLLNQGNFSAVVSHDIDEQLGLYKVSPGPVYVLGIGTLRAAYYTGLVPGTMDEMMDRIQDTEAILKRARKSQGSR